MNLVIVTSLFVFMFSCVIGQHLEGDIKYYNRLDEVDCDYDLTCSRLSTCKQGNTTKSFYILLLSEIDFTVFPITVLNVQKIDENGIKYNKSRVDVDKVHLLLEINKFIWRMITGLQVAMTISINSNTYLLRNPTAAGNVQIDKIDKYDLMLGRKGLLLCEKTCKYNVNIKLSGGAYNSEFSLPLKSTFFKILKVKDVLREMINKSQMIGMSESMVITITHINELKNIATTVNNLQYYCDRLSDSCMSFENKTLIRKLEVWNNNINYPECEPNDIICLNKNVFPSVHTAYLYLKVNLDNDTMLPMVYHYGNFYKCKNKGTIKAKKFTCITDTRNISMAGLYDSTFRNTVYKSSDLDIKCKDCDYFLANKKYSNIPTIWAKYGIHKYKDTRTQRCFLYLTNSTSSPYIEIPGCDDGLIRDLVSDYIVNKKVRSIRSSYVSPYMFEDSHSHRKRSLLSETYSNSFTDKLANLADKIKHALKSKKDTLLYACDTRLSTQNITCSEELVIVRAKRYTQMPVNCIDGQYAYILIDNWYNSVFASQTFNVGNMYLNIVCV